MKIEKVETNYTQHACKEARKQASRQRSLVLEYTRSVVLFLLPGITAVLIVVVGERTNERRKERRNERTNIVDEES